ncbi:MAG: nucleotidyltransferase substrate binding protein [Candidatus Sericytochromatia bacterium]
MPLEALRQFIDALTRWEAVMREAPEVASERFVAVFEAALAALLDALRYEGFALHDEEPKEILRKAFTALWIDDAQLWLDMLADRNRLAHAQSEGLAPHRLFTYFAELHRIAEVIKARPHVPPVVQELAERIGHLPRVKRVILFGSRARGDNQPRSDVDLALEADDEEVIFTARRLVEEAPTLLEIDLVAWPEATDELRSEIESEGIVLFPRS